MGTNRQFDKNSRSKTYKEINLFKKLNSQSQSSPRPLPPRIPSPTIPGSAQWPPTRPSDPATDRSTLSSVATMTSSQLRPNTGANRASLARPSSTTASTGPTAATALCSATGQCPKWALANQSTLSTTSARRTRTARSASARSTATRALASLSATLGDTRPSEMLSSPRTLPAHASASCSSATCSSSRTRTPPRTCGPRTTIFSGPRLAGTTKTPTTAPPAATAQSSTSAAAATPVPTTGSISTNSSAVPITALLELRTSANHLITYT